MKKGLLLSVVASGFIFAGGNIAPVQPVVPAAAAPAACDFWGSLGARYEAYDDDTSTGEFGDKANNTWKAAVTLGVEKELGYGFGFGAEVAGFTDLGLTDIAGNTKDVSEISQLYLTYKYGNTAIKAGRQTLPKNLSPWAWSDRTIGVVDRAYNGVVVANTDIANTTLVGAWIASFNDDGSDTTMINGSDLGLFMLAAEYTGVTNTTFDISAYYIPENNNYGKAYSVWASAQTKVSNFNLGLQAAYAKADAGSVANLGTGDDATYGVAGYIGTKYDAFDAKLTLAYINDGDATLNLGSTSAFWGNTFEGVIGANVVPGNKQTIAKLDLGYSLAYGKIYLAAAYDKPDHGEDAYGAALGYKFKVSGVNAKVEYRYIKNQDFTKRKDQRVRVEGVYKF